MQEISNSGNTTVNNFNNKDNKSADIFGKISFYKKPTIQVRSYKTFNRNANNDSWNQLKNFKPRSRKKQQKMFVNISHTLKAMKKLAILIYPTRYNNQNKWL